MVNLYPGNSRKDNESFKKVIMTPTLPAFTDSIELFSSRLKRERDKGIGKFAKAKESI